MQKCTSAPPLHVHNIDADDYHGNMHDVDDDHDHSLQRIMVLTSYSFSLQESVIFANLEDICDFHKNIFLKVIFHFLILKAEKSFPGVGKV